MIKIKIKKYFKYFKNAIRSNAKRVMVRKHCINSKRPGNPILYSKDAMLSLDNLIPGIRILKSQPDTKQIK